MPRKRSRFTRTRQTAFHGAIPQPVTQIAVTFDSATQGFEIADADPNTLRTQVYYERESGKDKVLASVPARSDLPAFDLWGQVLGQCSTLCAIDTNTRTVDGRRISVSLACVLPGRLNSLPKRIELQPLCGYAIFGVKDGTNPECVGWHLLLSNHILPARIPPHEVMGIVVDSELSRIPQLNARQLPYYGSNFLPTSTLLLYASSDANTATIPSEMLRYCDAMSTQLFNDLLPSLARQPDPVNGDNNFAGYVPLRLERTHA